MSLHRAIETGRASDDCWAELSRVCLELGYKDEALRSTQQIESPSGRLRAERYLARRVSGRRPKVRHVEDTRSPETVAAFREELTDAVGFLFLEHMPLTVMAATLVFPLVLGLGGFLTAGTEMWVFPSIALIPVLSAIGVVGALARQILIEAAGGLEEPPRIPEAGRLFRNAGRFLLDATTVLVVFVGPAILAMLAGLTPYYGVPLALAGASAVPLALALRLVRNDWQAIAPKVLARAAIRTGVPYLGVLLVTAVLFAPALAALGLTIGSELYLQMSFVGPLAIAPLFITSRLTGRILHLQRRRLGDLIADASGTLAAEVGRFDVGNAKTYREAARRTPGRVVRERGTLAGREGGRHPGAAARARPAQQQPQQPQQQPERRRPRVKAARHPENARPEPETPPARAAAAPPAPKASPRARPRPETRPRPRPAPPADSTAKRQLAQRKAEAEALYRALEKSAAPPPRTQPSDVVGEDIPDLMNLPGARVVRGKDRATFGAAAKR